MEYTKACLQAMVQNTAGYVVVYQVKDGAIVPLFFTDNVPSFSGLTREEYLALYGKDAAAVVPAADMPELAAKLNKLLAGEGDQEATYRTFHKTRGFVWTHVFFKLLGSCEGAPVLTGSFIDVSAATAAPDMLLDNSSQRVYVVERDSWDLLFANSVAQRDKLGVPRLGQTCYQYIRGRSAPCADCAAHQLRGEEPLETIWRDPARGKSYGVKIVPMRFFEKRACAFFIDDLTKHIDMEERLRQEQEKYRAATEGANLRVYEYDIKSRTIRLSEHSRRLFGAPDAVITDVPESILPYFYEKDHQRLRRFFSRVNSGEKQVTDIFPMKPVEGRAAYLRYTFTTVRDETGAPDIAYAVAEDITAQKLAEEEFNETLQALLSANPSALCSYKLDLTQNICSEEHGTSEYIRDMLRADTADDLFRNILSIIPDAAQRDEASKFFDRNYLLTRYAAGTKTLHLDYRRMGEKKNILWVRTFANLLKNPETNDIIAVFYSLDVTAEKRREEIFNIITNNEYDYVALLYPDINKIEFLSLNSRLLKKYHNAFGKPGELYDFDGTRMFAADNWISAEDREDYMKASPADAVREELDKNGHCELSIRGHYTGHPGEYMCRKIQHYYLDERKDTILIIQSDVTATYLQQQREAAMVKAEAHRVEDIIDSVATGICVLRMPDADHLEGDFVNLQMFRILGLTPPDTPDARIRMMNDPMVAGYMKNAFLAVHPDDREMVRRLFRDGYETSHFSAGNYRILKEDGGIVWVNQNAILREIRPDGHVFYSTYRVVDREMELQVQLERQLEREKLLRDQANAANAAKSEFLSRMSHDIRTPLNGIIGMTYLTKELDLPDKARENLEKIDTSSKFLLSLINDVLDMSKAESGKIELHPEPYEVTMFFEYLDSVIAPLCREKNISFSIDAEPDAGVLPVMDVLRINQVFFNLLSNAVKFTPEGGAVTFRLRERLTEGGRLAVLCEVSDTGIGMSAEFRRHLFEPFSQELRSDTSELRGTGLGLAIVKKLLDLMNCAIAVRSEPGKGTTFSVTGEFDCVEKDASAQSARTGAGADASSLRGIHVLLCEDHPLNQEIAKALLNEKGVVVRIAGDGQLGLKEFMNSAAGYYSAILMDIRMPVMDGYETARAIRALDRPDAGTVPIIAMTADTFSDDVQKCLDAGMNGHVAKPIAPDKLFEALESAIT